MNYAAHYERLIARARGRTLDGYKERHHVVPRCMGGCDEPENIVELTAEEHFCAHLLLAKIHPGIPRLVNAAYFMSFLSPTNKTYAWVKRRLAHSMRGNRRSLGLKRSLETRAKMSAAMRGNTNGRGKKLPPFTAEHRARMSAVRIGKKQSPETIEKRASKLRGRKYGPPSPETRAKMSAAHIGKKRGPCSPETKAKIAAAHLARLAA